MYGFITFKKSSTKVQYASDNNEQMEKKEPTDDTSKDVYSL